MKKLLVSLAVAFVTAGAAATPAPALPAGPVYLQYFGQEQIAINGAHTFGDKEINWGVFIVDSLARGKVGMSNESVDPDTTTKAFFTNGSGGQIAGMFYGVEQGGFSASNAFPATSGFLDLYWRDTSKAAPTAIDISTLPNIRCGYNCATGFTDGILLAHLYFDTGMDDSNDGNTIVGSQVPTAKKGFRGFASSYLSVDMSQKGLWSQQLNADWFATAEGNRDLRIDNVYSTNTNWNGATGSNILGVQLSSGSGQAYALPEPGALSLMGLAMIGMGVALRRRRG
jgi:hypothetical protein